MNHINQQISNQRIRIIEKNCFWELLNGDKTYLATSLRSLLGGRSTPIATSDHSKPRFDFIDRNPLCPFVVRELGRYLTLPIGKSSSSRKTTSLGSHFSGFRYLRTNWSQKRLKDSPDVFMKLEFWNSMKSAESGDNDVLGIVASPPLTLFFWDGVGRFKSLANLTKTDDLHCALYTHI